VNRALPPGDCGSQSSAAGRPPRYRGVFPGVTRLVLGTAVLAGCPRVGPRFASDGTRSRRGRLPAVFGQGSNRRPGAPGIPDKRGKARRGRSRAGQGGRPCYWLMR
jgi:hypothetical protein